MKSKSRIANSTAAVTALLLTFSLTYPEWSSDTSQNEARVEASTIGQDQPETASAPAPKPLQYVSFKVDGKQSLAQLKSRFGEEGLLTILKINRVDPANLRKGTELMVPAEAGELLEFSPFPHSVDAIKDIPKLILVSRRIQAFGAYEEGKLVWWGPTSTGKKSTQTPAGLFHTNWKARLTRSTVNSSWVLPWTFNLDNFGGIAFHQYALPGYPASHGCVRLLESDAKWVYGWSDQWILSTPEKRLLANGTPVIIFDDYAFGQPPPWKRLSSDANAASVTVAEIQKQLDKHLPVIEARAHERETVIATTAEVRAK